MIMTLKERITGIKKLYPSLQSAILPSLYAAQEVYGWLSQEAMREVSEHTGVPPAEIKGVATYYAMYRNKPMGRHVIQLCTNVACMLMGAETLVEFLNGKYGLAPGQTTGDGRFTLIIMECIGACATAPAMLVNEDFHENLTKENIVEILERYK
jgi:NADH-quinone oxidoreductase E subunit